MVNYSWDNIFKKDPNKVDIGELLSQSYIFSNLTRPELNFIQNMVHIRNYKPNEIIFNQGELGVGMYLISEGSVNISFEDLQAQNEEDKNVFVTRLTRGDFFGEISLVESAGRRTATATSAENTVLVGFFKPDLSEVVERNPRIAVKILSRLGEILGRRLKETSDKYSDLKRDLKNSVTRDASK